MIPFFYDLIHDKETFVILLWIICSLILPILAFRWIGS